MGLEDLVIRKRLDKQLAGELFKLNNAGFFTRKESEERGMRLAVGGFEEDNIKIKFFLLVDRSDGVIVDARFQAFAPPSIVGAANFCCNLIVGGNYRQAQSLSMPGVERTFVTPIRKAVEDAVQKCLDIPISIAASANVPMTEETALSSEEWDKLDKEAKLALVERVLNDEVRYLIAMDGGGVEVVALRGSELIIGYQGACASCFSAVGSTLSFIQQTLRAKVYSDLVVIPRMESQWE